MKTAIGMDIGGTKIEGSLIDADGQILETLRFPSPDRNGPMLELLEQMVAQLADNQTITGVGFSIPGSLDPQGVLRNAPNSSCINGTSLKRDLEARLPYPLEFENDANCLILSEFRFGSAKGYQHAVGLILGTGIGGGVIHEGRLFHGWRGLAPEPGHLPLNMNGRICLCGNRGCVESYLSGPSILKRYREQGGIAHTTKDVFENTDDPIARAVLEETAQLYARFIALLISVYDPEIFVLGGGLSLQPFYYRQKERISRLIFGHDAVPPIVAAQHGDTSGKLGAAALVL